MRYLNFFIYIFKKIVYASTNKGSSGDGGNWRILVGQDAVVKRIRDQHHHPDCPYDKCIC